MSQNSVLPSHFSFFYILPTPAAVDLLKNAMCNSLLRFLKAAADLILPRRCIVCGRKLLLDEKHLCLSCLCDMPLTYFWKQPYNPMADRFNAAICEADLDADGYVRACALFFYDSKGSYKQIPYQLKYSANISAGRFFGKMLGERMAAQEHWQDVDCVIPVPLHWRRKWKRGYNQAEIIAGAVAQALGAEICCNMLLKSKYTRTQTKVDVEQKRQNVQGSFRISRESGPFPYNHILIIDDTFTTGSTLLSCYETLIHHLPSNTRISIATLGYVGNA